MKSNARTIKYFDCAISAFGTSQIYSKTSMPCRPLGELLKEIERVVKQTPFYRENRARTESWHIADIEVDLPHNRAVLLITRSDKLAADQAISNPETREFIVASKSEVQGNAYSSHIVFGLNPVDRNTYLTVMEEATGISSGDVSVLLGMATRMCCKVNPDFFLCKDASGGIDEKGNSLVHKTRYRFDMRGHPSPDFVNQLNGGKIQGLEVVASAKKPVIWDGEGGAVSEKKQVIYLKPELKKGSWFDLVTSVCNTATGKNMESVRVLFTDAEDFHHTLELDSQSMQILNEDRYVKKARLDSFATRLDTACEKIHTEVRDKMFLLL